eukprot:gb/GEZN01013698.1/.p1 GENE.gb/GEZN01013698.1/~~gb/GEZN01013698.1/.p1  ORF type:complete len:266 (+),score=71.56 gb/GEZN01013698.1/:67-864(+)
MADKKVTVMERLDQRAKKQKDYIEAMASVQSDVEGMAKSFAGTPYANNPEVMNKLVAAMTDFVKMEQSFTDQQAALVRVRQTMADSAEGRDAKELFVQYMEEEHGKELSKKRKTVDQKVQDMKKKMKTKQAAKPDEEENDAELEVLDTQVSFICPITKAPFEKPMKNKQCGHSYSKEAVEALVQTQNRDQSMNTPIDCAVAGCSKKIVLKELVKDTAIEKLMKAKAAAEKSKGKGRGKRGRGGKGEEDIDFTQTPGQEESQSPSQ